MKNKLLAIVLTTTVLSLSIMGCASSKNQGTVQNEAGSGTEGQPSSEDTSQTSEKVKLTGMVIKGAATNDISTMQWLQDAMDRANVEIEWQVANQVDWNEVKGTMTASGDIPDVVIGTDAFASSDFVTFNGLFKDVAPYLDMAPNIQKMFTDHPDLLTLAQNENGEIFGIPKYQAWWPDSWYRQYINKQWLDTLGLDVPTTWDELYTVLKAFKEQDPNGNGEADEIPWAFMGMDTKSVAPYILLSNFGMTFDLSNSANGFYVEDGVVKNYLGSDEYYQLVEYCHKLYQEGLIGASSFTQDDAAWVATARTKEASGEAVYGYVNCWAVGDIVGDQLKDQYVSIPPLKVTADQTATPLWTNEYEMLNVKACAAVIAESCENPEAAVRFIDELYAPETSLAILFGDIGSMVKKNDDGSYTVLSPAEAGDTSGLNAGGWRWKVTLADLGPGCIDETMDVKLPEDMDEVTEDGKYQTELFAKMDTRKNLLHKMFLKFEENDLSQLSLIESNIQSLTVPQFTDWVVNGGLEDEWDNYLVNLKASGVDDGIKIYQKALDEYLSKN